MSQSLNQKERLKSIANRYSAEAIKNMKNAVCMYMEDCKSGKYTLEEIQLIVSLTDIYYSVKTGVIDRETAKEMQNKLLENI